MSTTRVLDDLIEAGLAAERPRRHARHAQDPRRVAQRLARQTELATDAEGVAEDALDDAAGLTGGQAELQPAAKRVTEQAHPLETALLERRLEAVEGSIECPPAGKGED